MLLVVGAQVRAATPLYGVLARTTSCDDPDAYSTPISEYYKYSGQASRQLWLGRWPQTDSDQINM